jgi:hypothetical protein
MEKPTTNSEHSLVIQGKFSEAISRTLFANHQVFQHIVVSCWEEDMDSIAELMQTSSADLTNVTFVFSSLDDLVNTAAHQSISRQVVTTNRGLQEVSTFWVTKVRSDEFYDLSSWVKKFPERNSDSSPPKGKTSRNEGLGRILFSNFIVRPWNYHKFHISDHLFGGPTAVIRKTFESLNRADSPCAKNSKGLSERDSSTPESLIGRELFTQILHFAGQVEQPSSSTRTPGIESDWKSFSQHFDLVDLHHLGRFEVRANQAGVQGVTSLKNLASIFSSRGRELDFYHYKTLNSLSPKPKWLHKLSKFLRYALRAVFGRQ